MNPRELFPFRIFASLPSRGDRRACLTAQLAHWGLEAAWLEPVPVAAIREARGFRNERKRSCALTKRHAIRLAERAGAPSLLYFEDDAIFHPQFAERVAALELPDDWGIFYFGCQHAEPPAPVAPGLVRVARAFDFHACAIRAPYFRAARAAMRGSRFAAKPLHSDVLFSDLHKVAPTYAAFPNLTWQARSHSDLAGVRYSNYSPTGRQIPRPHVLEHLRAPVAA